jgi:transposase
VLGHNLPLQPKHPTRYQRGFFKLKQFRAVATRYGKRQQIYQGTVDIASTRIWLRKPAT